MGLRTFLFGGTSTALASKIHSEASKQFFEMHKKARGESTTTDKADFGEYSEIASPEAIATLREALKPFVQNYRLTALTEEVLNGIADFLDKESRLEKSKQAIASGFKFYNRNLSDRNCTMFANDLLDAVNALVKGLEGNPEEFNDYADLNELVEAHGGVEGFVEALLIEICKDPEFVKRLKRNPRS